MTIPPSPVVKPLTGWNEKIAMSEWRQDPTGSSADVRADRVRGVLDDRDVRARRAARISSIGAASPAKCTGTTAFVRSLRAAAIVSAVTFQVDGSISAKRGVAPTYAAQFALAANVIALVTSSSPGPRPATHAAACSAAVPEEKATAYGAPTACCEVALERRDRRPLGQPLAAHDRDHGLDVALADRLAPVRDHYAAARASPTISASPRMVVKRGSCI